MDRKRRQRKSLQIGFAYDSATPLRLDALFPSAEDRLKFIRELQRSLEGARTDDQKLRRAIEGTSATAGSLDDLIKGHYLFVASKDYPHHRAEDLSPALRNPN